MLGTHQIFMDVLADFALLVIIIAPVACLFAWWMDKRGNGK